MEKNKKLISLNVTAKQREVLNSLGGVTAGFNEIYGFFIRHYSDYQTEKQRESSVLNRIRRDKK